MGKAIDLTGQKFARLTVVRRADERLCGKVRWECICDCGNTTFVAGGDLKTGNTKSCGCLNIDNLKSRQKNDITGKKFGKLTVVSRSDKKTKYGNFYWYCKCNCGKTIEVIGGNLKSGTTKSCGCLNHRRGQSHPNYNYSLSQQDREDNRDYPEYKDWREAVFERDSYTCQKCGEAGVVLNAHHIESYGVNKDLRTTLENGITLCKDCHDNFHHIYGRGNNTKEQFDEWMGEEV